MHVSLLKKGGQALTLTLLSLCLSLGSSGLASAHSSASQASLQGGPEVYINPGTVKETTNGTSGFVLYGHHLSSMTPYTVTSADLGGASCPLTLPATLPITAVTDIEGNFVQSFSVGTTATTITTTVVNNIVITPSNGGTTADITMPNPFGNGTIAITIPATFGTTTVTIPNPFGSGTTTATITYTANPNMLTITIPNPAGGGGTISIANPTAPATNPGIVVTTTPGTPCIPNTYHLSVQQPTTHALYDTSVTIKA